MSESDHPFQPSLRRAYWFPLSRRVVRRAVSSKRLYRRTLVGASAYRAPLLAGRPGPRRVLNASLFVSLSGIAHLPPTWTALMIPERHSFVIMCRPMPTRCANSYVVRNFMRSPRLWLRALHNEGAPR